MYLFNRYPAKVFVGDVGTLGIGATYATAAIIGNIATRNVKAILSMSLISFATKYGSTQKQERLHGSPLTEFIFSRGASSSTTPLNGDIPIIATASRSNGITFSYTRSRTSFSPF